MTSSSTLDRGTLLGLLREVGQLLVEHEATASIHVIGGAAMVLEFDSRRMTRDVDAVLRSEGGNFWKAIATVTRRHGLPPDWLNTNAAAFLPNDEDENASELNFPGLTVSVASAEHLMAMKLRAMRDRDIADLMILFGHLGIETPEQAAAIHDRLFDESAIGYLPENDVLYAAELVLPRIQQS